LHLSRNRAAHRGASGASLAALKTNNTVLPVRYSKFQR
jgi:hypothetical protein